METQVKICGLTTPDDARAAALEGAAYGGMVFYAKSPRYISVKAGAEIAAAAQGVGAGLRMVGLFVSPDNALVESAAKYANIDMLQLHGEESPARVAEIRRIARKPVMKAVRIAGPGDIAQIAAYERIADWILCDAKVDGAYGGTGQAFDWQLLKDYKFTKPWMLAGGLTAENVGAAIAALKPAVVDVSSGVETAPGQKDACKIRAFVDSVRHADQQL